MIYEYPEDFVVPVVYDKGLNPMYRDLEFKYVKVEEVLMPNEQQQEEKMYKMDEYQSPQNMSMNSPYMDEYAVQKPHKYSMFDCSETEEPLGCDCVKAILNEIDNEYANSETLNR